MGEELQDARRLERGEFADAHRVLIDELQGRAVTLQYSMDLLDKKKQQLADEEAVVMRRKDDVKQAEDKLAEARAATDKQMQELRQKSDALHKMRIDGRDLLGENLELERADPRAGKEYADKDEGTSWTCSARSWCWRTSPSA